MPLQIQKEYILISNMKCLKCSQSFKGNKEKVYVASFGNII